MQVKKAVIAAAGFGSRFLPVTKTFPKELLPIIDKPIIHYLVDECAEAGIEEVIIVVSPSEVDKFENYFYGKAINLRTLMVRQGKLDRWNKVEKIFGLPAVTIVPQDERLPYGNGSPLLSVKDFVMHEPAFAVLFGDDMVLAKVGAVKQMVDYFLANPCDGLMGVQEVSRSEISKYAALKMKDGTENEVERVIEKPKPEEAPSLLMSYGRFIMTPKIFDYLVQDATGKDNELWLQDANDKVAVNGKVLCHKVDGEWMTTGDPLRYLKTHIKFALNDPEIGAEIRKYINENLG